MASFLPMWVLEPLPLTVTCGPVAGCCVAAPALLVRYLAVELAKYEGSSVVYPLLIEVEIYFIVSSQRVMHSSTMAIFSHNSCDRLQARKCFLLCSCSCAFLPCSLPSSPTLHMLPHCVSLDYTGAICHWTTLDNHIDHYGSFLALSCVPLIVCHLTIWLGPFPYQLQMCLLPLLRSGG